MIGNPKKAILIALVFLIFAGLIFSLGASGNTPIISSNSQSRLPDTDGTENTIEIDSFYSCRIEGIIEPSLANHIKKCLILAKDSGYGLIITMDTPGGLEASMR